MAEAGRPPIELTEDIIAKVCAHLRNHGFRETAIAMAGVSKFTVRNWIRQGARDVREGRESIFADFCNRMDKAEIEAEAELIGGIQSRGLEAFVRSSFDGEKGHSETLEPPDWKALAWIAERRGAKRWGIKKHLTVAIDKDREKLLALAEKTLDSDAFDKLLAAIASSEDAESAGEGDAGEEESGE
jgi:hypothetical protein